ncbi:putative DnaJ domain, Chaperone J-domain superfamily [Helianthus annuus]|nr:putative DnaJ domain, Chaperone J-domain superfamily [Helianthus annuus]
MECNRDEAKRAKEIAENKFSTKDITGAKKFALKAQSLYPALDGISQFLAILDVYAAAENKINGELDFYGILGLNPLADDDAIKKHYRKLALSLHPDKNKSVGAEGAFQFVSEAWTVLSDKEKRSIYDHKRNAKQRVHTQNGGSRAPKPPTQNGFHKFTKTAAAQTRVTSTKAKGTSNSQKDGIHATTKTETGPTKMETAPTKTETVPSKTETGLSPAKTGPSGVRSSSNKETVPKTFWTLCKRCKLQYEFLRKYLDLNLLCPTCHGPFHATETAPPSTYGSLEGSENPEMCKTTGDGRSSQWSRFIKTNSPGTVKRDREEAYNREEDLRRKISKKETKAKQDDNGAVENNKKGPIEVKKDVANTSSIKSQLIKKATMEIRKKLNEWSSETVKDSLVAEPLVTDVPDPEFHDFDSARSEKCFEEGQVWAVYDHDGMPRLYALIKKVISLKPFKMSVCWFDPKPDNNPGFLNAFGEFKPGKHEIVSAPNFFSHKASFTKQTSGNIRVFPRKGDVCALYRNDVKSDLVKNKYEIVEVDAYDEETGTIMTPLIKVSGFKTVFHRHVDPKETRVIGENEMHMFSHEIPACVLTGEESGRAPKGCLELDPAAVPPQFLEGCSNSKC